MLALLRIYLNFIPSVLLGGSATSPVQVGLPPGMAAAATDLLPLVAAGVLGVVLVLLLVRRQASAYAGHVGQLAPGKKKPSPLDRAGMGKREMRVFSREEVARHASREDAWIIVRDPETREMNVYDVTEYVDEHPGGEVRDGGVHAGGCTCG